MSEVTVSQTRFYQVTPGQQVQLKVTIGNGQVGGTALTLNGQPIAIDNNTGVATIGQPGQDLRHSVLNCATLIHDRNPNTNRTSATYVFNGGPLQTTFPFDVSVDADGGDARYLIAVIFF